MSGGEAPARAAETALLAEIAKLAPPGVKVGCRAIRDGDEKLLLPEEAQTISSRQLHTRRASGAARAIARQLLVLEGIENPVIKRSASGAPLWPAGITGSLAHDDVMAVAAVARKAGAVSLGIDVEPAEPLPADIADIVPIFGDILDGIDQYLALRLLFSAKEAVYKASFPLDGKVLGYEHIAVDLQGRKAVTATGRRAQLWFCLFPRVVVLAEASADAVAPLSWPEQVSPNW
ncbi:MULTISPECIES: 4'-phosphopantetheinyl transferase family protein [Rhizobium]|uniref:Enterobactin synthase component D n=1 Tax=Rhizobium miluonense TaxID=411945 RepID=A0A1C3WUX8_9HYPH|nr:4'-phosphopantetheinyl transferase superfamily protein [Rhizobium miluonense]SCB43799.1 4'-phosphopantetheinyl transferase EntD (siderophore biosynthesis) [Rhizobium miluonense]